MIHTMTNSNYKRGQYITYTREIMFKGSETVSAKIVAIGRTTLLLDNGDEIRVF